MRKFILLSMIIGLSVSLISCTNNEQKEIDFTTWNDEEVYAFLNEVHEYIRTEMPVETNSEDKVIKQYERYFTPEWSEKIFRSLYNKTENGWKIPDGDAGYMFVVLGNSTESSGVTIEYSKDYIRIRETYHKEMWMYSAIEYTITYTDRPVISDWKVE